MSFKAPTKCPHEPQTDEEKRNKPQDSWCDQCQIACCRICVPIHEKHIQTGNAQATINNDAIKQNPDLIEELPEFKAKKEQKQKI